MIDADDIQLQIKKKARRRLVGAVAFCALAVLVLPIVMDQEPAPPAQDVEIRIPGQDERPFQPRVAPSPPDIAPPPASTSTSASTPSAPVTPPASTPAASTASPVTATAPQNVARVIQKVPGTEARPAETPPAARPEARPPANTRPATGNAAPVAVPAESAATAEARRAAAILAGKSPSDSTPAPSTPAAAPVAATAVPHVILIGAFINESNVQNLRTKLGELGIKVYTEPLESPQGLKTRVRAGPFPNRDAAENALKKMERIGVSGVVAAK
jgi:DedD protein